jgi:hypothetical protein
MNVSRFFGVQAGVFSRVDLAVLAYDATEWCLPILAEARGLVLEKLAVGVVKLYINGLKIPLTAK